MAFVLLTRWPYRGGILEEYDSANYAFALDRIDPEAHAPHPPGYILFVWASRLVHLFVSEPVRALATVNVLSGVAVAALLYALLRLGMSRGEAAVASFAALSAAQVWFQQTRPMEDSFAFAAMLAAALPLALAIHRHRRAVLPGFFLAGFVLGAKQVLALFLFALACRALWTWLREDRGLALRAVGASVLGVLIWLVPLCVYTGSFANYLWWGWGQVLWLDREALVTNPPLLSERLHAVFVVPWAMPVWAWLWVPAVWGAVVAWRERPRLRFLFWLLLPILAVRIFALGQWPRFSIYYLPFLLAFVVVAASDLGKRFIPATTALGRVVVAASAAAALWVWADKQARFILPTLKILRDGPSPVAEAIRTAKSRFDPRESMIVVPIHNRVVLRQAEYYGSRAGFAVVEERDLKGPELRGRQHLLVLYGSGRVRVDGRWAAGPTRLATFSLPLTRWTEVSLWDDVWDVGLAEQTGAFVRFVDWAEDPDGALVAAARAHRVDVLRPPEQGFTLRLRVDEKRATRSGRYRINREAWRRFARDEDEIVLRVLPDQVINNRVRIALRPACAPGTRECLRVVDWKIDEDPRS